MPRFEPFAGLRYAADVPFADVIAPPYDVVDDEGRVALENRHPANSIRLELPQPEGDVDRYTAASNLLDRWVSDGTLLVDEEPAFYVYRMGFHDEAGRPRQTAGVLGALGLEPPGEGDILPHERTLPKAKSDRLDLLRATRTNISPVWGLSLAAGLSGLCELPGPPDARATDDDGVHHRLWRITSPGVVEAIASAVASAPVVIADGHHRFETALNYQREQREAGAGDGDHDLMLTYVVELAEEQLAVRAIHRLVTGLPDGFDLVAALDPWFEAFETPEPDETLTSRMVDAGALGLHTSGGTWLLRPRGGRFDDIEHDLDSVRFDVARAAMPEHALSYQHGWDHVTKAVAKGEADAAVLLRPATIAQIGQVAHARTRMPEKTTFFTPKPKTGMVFRRLAR